MVLRTASPLVACLLALVGSSRATAQDAADPAREFFAKGSILRLELTLDPAAREALRREPRTYVAGTIRVDGKDVWTGLGIKLKGSAGSFRNVDEQPGFTVHLGKFGGETRLHGLKKFHLNNGAQDESRLHEWFGGEVFAAAGYPAARVAHARLWFDGQDLGLYVLRESFDGEFAKRNFGNQVGNLYDGGFCRDLDENLDKDAGGGSDDLADLVRLREICREFDPERATRFEQAFDVRALADFCALEALLGHWDGYSLNRNNYRLWIPVGGGARFLPHGMDQLLGDRDAPILDHPTALAASAFMQRPEWRKLYRERLKALLPHLASGKLTARTEALGAKLVRELKRDAPEQAASLDRAVKDLVARVRARYQFLRDEVNAPEPKPLDLAVGKPLPLKRWQPGARTDHIEVGKKAFAGAAAWHAAARGKAGERVHGVFACHVLLSRGRYRLLAKVRTDGVAAGPDDAPGAFLEVDGARSEVLLGDGNWRELACEFEVGEFQRNVELRLELRATDGKVWFRADSPMLLRVE